MKREEWWLVMRLSAWDESNRVAFEPGRVDLIAVGDPQWCCAVVGGRGASSSVNDLGFPPLDDLNCGCALYCSPICTGSKKTWKQARLGWGRRRRSAIVTLVRNISLFFSFLFFLGRFSLGFIPSWKLSLPEGRGCAKNERQRP